MGLLLPSSAYLTAPIHGGAGEEYDVKLTSASFC